MVKYIVLNRLVQIKSVLNVLRKMTYREEKYLLETVRENNKMLKEIIKYINYTISQASDENMDDFGRNILAKLISERIKK